MAAVHEAFESRLAEVAVPPEVARLYYEVLLDEAAEAGSAREERRAEITREMAALEEKLTDVDERFLEGAIAADSYGRLKARFAQRLETLRAEGARLVAGDSDLAAQASYGLSLLSNLVRCYREASLEGKRDLVGLLFPGRLVYRAGRVETSEMHPVIGLFEGRKAESRRGRRPKRAVGPVGYRVRDSNPCDHRERVAS